VCDVSSHGPADAVMVDVLARLQLTARRCGHGMSLRFGPQGSRELIELCGLTTAVPLWSGSDLEAVGQAEQREQSRRVEEERDPGDLPV
jgi:hypothetical protein